MQQYPVQPIPGHGKGVASLVLGILAIVCGGVIFGIIGIVLGKQAKSEAQAAGMINSVANAGFVVSIIGTIYGALWFVGVIAYYVFIVVIYGAIIGSSYFF
jgi:hypothetical protein